MTYGAPTIDLAQSLANDRLLDAGRARMAPRHGPQPDAPQRRGRVRRRIGSGLIRLGERLQPTDPQPAGRAPKPY